MALGGAVAVSERLKQIHQTKFSAAGIHVAEYLTVLPPPEVLGEKLHKAIKTARARIEVRENDGATKE